MTANDALAVGGHSDAPFGLLTSCPRPGVVVAVASGEIDMATATRLDDALRTATAEGCRHLVLDLRAVTFFSGAGIGTVLAVRDRATRTGFELHLTGVTGNRPVFMVLDVTGVVTQFDIHPSVDAALASIGNGDEPRPLD